MIAITFFVLLEILLMGEMSRIELLGFKYLSSHLEV
jgi:hypothetical protein